MYANATYDAFSISNRWRQLAASIVDLRKGQDVLPINTGLAERVLKGTVREGAGISSDDQRKRRQAAVGFYYRELIASLKVRTTKGKFLKYFRRKVAEDGFVMTEELNEIFATIYDVLYDFKLFVLGGMRQWAQEKLKLISLWTAKDRRFASRNNWNLIGSWGEEIIDLGKEIGIKLEDMNQELMFLIVSRLE